MRPVLRNAPRFTRHALPLLLAAGLFVLGVGSIPAAGGPAPSIRSSAVAPATRERPRQPAMSWAGVPQGGTDAAPPGFAVTATIPVGRAPHGIRFSGDGDTAYVALAGDDAIAVVDLEQMRVRERIPAGNTPLDLVALADGGWVVTQFRGDVLLRLGSAGTPKGWKVGKSPSLFAPATVNDVAYLVSEFADRLTLFDTSIGAIVGTFPTGKRPYPADVTPDGVLAFVPNRDADSVSVIDLLNEKTLAETPVCTHPEGGALTRDGVSYVVACGGDDQLAYINTASFEVTGRVSGTGPRPFSVAMTLDGRWGLVNNAGGDTVSLLDVGERRIVGQLQVGQQPIVVRMHPDGRRALVSSEVSGTVSVIELPPPPKRPRGGALTEVVVFGMIHDRHRTSQRYGLDVLRAAIRAVNPDLVLAEIPPNRFDAAARQFAATGKIIEPRVVRFPEYVDVLFPLTRQMSFRIVPTAGWNKPMSDYRNAALKRIASDPDRAEEWAAYQAAEAESEKAVAAGGAPDDPLWIHTDGYDQAQEIALSAYNRFDAELGTGGWDTINTAHYANIARALDQVAGQGKRVLITYGAGHKGWFLRHLRQRADIELLDARQFFAHDGRRP